MKVNNVYDARQHVPCCPKCGSDALIWCAISARVFTCKLDTFGKYTKGTKKFLEESIEVSCQFCEFVEIIVEV